MEQLSRELFKEFKRNGDNKNGAEHSELLRETIAKIVWSEAEQLTNEGKVTQQDKEELIIEVLKSLLLEENETGRSRLSNEFAESGCSKEKDILFFLIQQVRCEIKNHLEDYNEN